MKVTERSFNTPISPYDVRDYHISGVAETFPVSFELARVSIKNQGAESSCVAHAASTIVEYFNSVQQENNTVFSTEFIYGYRPEGYYVGDGMYLRDALKTLQKVGVPPLEKLRGNHSYKEAMKNVEEKLSELKDVAYPNRISTYMRLTSTKEIKQALQQYGYVLCSMPWYKDYKLKKGVYTYSTTKKSGNHAVVIYGWNEDGWLVQNSWGSGWGQKGCFIIPFDFKWNETWAVTDTIVNNIDIIIPEKNWFIKLFSKFINLIVNIFRKKN
jgi:C1A family cysteine protease